VSPHPDLISITGSHADTPIEFDLAIGIPTAWRAAFPEQYVFTALTSMFAQEGTSNFTAVYFIYLADREPANRNVLRDNITHMFPQMHGSGRLRFLEVARCWT
jgi:hypothetical protein